MNSVYKAFDLLALFTAADKFSVVERRVLYVAANKGEVPFKEVMGYWKDSHSDPDVRAAALVAYNALST